MGFRENLKDFTFFVLILFQKKHLSANKFHIQQETSYDYSFVSVLLFGRYPRPARRSKLFGLLTIKNFVQGDQVYPYTLLV